MSMVSVIVPAYNVEMYLEECVYSILGQTYKETEVLLVDDGSTDNTSVICDRFIVIDPRVKVIHQQNGGLSAARNAGLDASSGEFVVFIDGDDYWGAIDLLEKVVKIADENIDIVFFGSTDYSQDTGGFARPKFTFSMQRTDEPRKLSNVFIDLAAKDDFSPSVCLKLFRKRLLLSNDLYFPKGITTEDIWWTMKLLLFASEVQCALLNYPFYIYRQRSDSISHTIGKRNLENYFDIIDHFSREVLKAKLDQNYQRHMLGYLSYHLYCMMGLCERIPIDERHLFQNKMKKLKWLKEYDISRKTRYSKFALTIFGFRLSCMIFGRYIVFSR